MTPHQSEPQPIEIESASVHPLEDMQPSHQEEQETDQPSDYDQLPTRSPLGEPSSLDTSSRHIRDRRASNRRLKSKKAPLATSDLPADRPKKDASVSPAVPSKDAATYPPVATYRLEFSHNFTFQDARRIVAYLYALGISDCYASPYLKVPAESTHGYDITEHNQLNPALGGVAGY